MNAQLSRRRSFIGGLRCTVALAVAVLLAGCTHVQKMKVSPIARIADPHQEKLPLKVGLMLDEPYCSYTHKWERMGDTWIFPLGPVLKSQSISVCEQTFRSVVVSTNGVLPAGVDVILTPRVYKLGFAFGHAKGFLATLLVEWTMRDQDNHNLLWLTTVEGHLNSGWGKAYRELFDELAIGASRRFRESPEIRRVVGQERLVGLQGTPRAPRENAE